MINCSNGIYTNQFLALQHLYLATQGENWKWENKSFGVPWNFTDLSDPLSIEDLTRPCGTDLHKFSNWQGLVCDRLPIESICSIHSINLIDYGLNGTLPTSIGEFKSLRYLKVDSNNLRGTIPTEIRNLSKLLYFGISNNQFKDIFPISLLNLTDIFEIRLEFNYLFGTIPFGLGSLKILNYFDVESNLFHGQIPSDLSMSRSLVLINFHSNFLTNSIPSSIGLLSNLISLDFQMNSLTGTIPTDFRGLKSISFLTFAQNYFTGSLPSILGFLTEITFFALSDNYFSDSISFVPWENLKKMTSLFIDYNQFIGQIPSQIGNLDVELLEIDFNHNLFTGSIPVELGQLNQLSFLYLPSNFLTGTIPNSLVNLKQVTTFAFNINLLSGTLPTDILISKRLYSFFISENFISGPIVFPPIHEIPLLRNFIGYNNHFSGLLPKELFSLPLIEVISLSLNCFDGTLPSCSLSTETSFYATYYSNSLMALDLSDLSNGPGCRYYPFHTLPHSGFLPIKPLTGQFPSCLLNLPKLNSLFMAGNGLTGMIEISSEWSCETTSLQSLILSENQLIGTLPKVLQTCELIGYLDLSYNRISGTLESNLVVSKNSKNSFFCVSNRLSGRLPLNFNLTDQGVNSLVSNVLEGNMFDFSNVGHDHSHSVSSRLSLYNGSTNLNSSLYLALAVISIIIIFFVSVKFTAIPNDQILSLFFQSLIYNPISNNSNIDFIIGSSQLNVSFLFSVACLVFFSIIYVLMKDFPIFSQDFSTQSYQYAWVLSASFLHGWLPSVSLGFFIICMIIIVQPATYTFNNAINPIFHRIIEAKNILRETNYLSFYSLSLLGFNVIFMLFLNGLYLIVLLHLNSNASLFQILIGVVKCIWNAILSPLCVKLFPSSPRQLLWFGFFFRVFNLVIVTYVSGLLNESSCLYPLFVNHQINSFSFEYTNCYKEYVSVSYNQTSIYCIQFTNYPINLPPTSPPFIYHFQCATSLIINYSPVLIYTILSTIIWHCIQICVVIISNRIKLNLPFFLVSDINNITLTTLIQLMVNLTLLLTYGLACPYLGFILIFSTWFQIFVFLFFSNLPSALAKQAALNRESIEGIGLSHLPQSFENKISNLDLQEEKDISTNIEISTPSTQIIELSQAFDSILPGWLFFISLVVGGFWSFQFFDMIGDVYGVTQGILVSLCYFGSIIVICCILYYQKKNLKN